MSDANRINGADTTPLAQGQTPTHGAIPLPMLSSLLKHFKETPMAHDVSDPFVKCLSTLPLITLQPAPAAQEIAQ